MQSAPAESDNFYVFRVARRLVAPSVRSRQNVEFPLGDKEPLATSGVLSPLHAGPIARIVLSIRTFKDITSQCRESIIL